MSWDRTFEPPQQTSGTGDHTHPLKVAVPISFEGVDGPGLVFNDNGEVVWTLVEVED